MTQQRAEYDRGLLMVASASGALDAAGLEHWFFGGWAVDLWVGRLTRPHDDIDVLVWRRDEARVGEALQGAGWVHTPTPEDLLGTSYARDGLELQLTFVVPGAEGEVVVPVPEQPLALSATPEPAPWPERTPGLRTPDVAGRIGESAALGGDGRPQEHSALRRGWRW
jgi:hypothetical protein